MSGLSALDAYRQFIVWQRVSNADGTVDKLPINYLTGSVHDAHDGSAWTDRQSAQLRARELGAGYGVGFVFTSADPFWFIDLDNVANGSGWKPIVNEVYQYVQGAAIGLSQSGQGLHIIGTGQVPTNRRIRPLKDLDAQGLDGLYTDGRFVALSEHPFGGDAATDCTEGLTAMIGRWFTGGSGRQPTDWTADPVPEWSGPTNDAELVKMALRSRSGRSVFGGGVSFAQLWEADADALGRRWPCRSGDRPWDYSEADAALAQHLAFWTGKNCDRIDRLMRQSKLCRDKYDRADYLVRTITRAVGLQTSVLQAKAPQAPQAPQSKDPNYRTDSAYMSVPEQVDYFRGCVYVTAIHKMITPNGMLLKPDQFKARYGGHVFALGFDKEAKTTKSAFEAFTLNQSYTFPRVDDMCFEPLRPPGEVTNESGRKYVNSFVPLYGEQIEGDVGIFLDHVTKLIPDINDREILLSYMAACVQHVGTKFQWCPVVQGVEGNGKTVLFDVLMYALGSPYCHSVDPNDIGNVFNAWIENKLLCIVEEIWTNGRYETAERLKPLITNRTVPLQGKGADQRTAKNIANFLLFSNHTDAVLKTRTDRRYAVLYTAQQEETDLARDGMTDAYFARLYNWLDGPGLANVAEYLCTRRIDINPLGRAPRTTSTEAAIVQSLGIAEQMILEAIGEGVVPGLTDNLIEVGAARLYLAANGKKLGPQAIARSLKLLGFRLHPALNADGRINVDGKRLRIYVRKGSQEDMIDSSAALIKAWRAALTSCLSY